MAKRPHDLIYSVDENPPLRITLVNSLLYIADQGVDITYALLLAPLIGCSPSLGLSLVSATLLVHGIGTFLQAYGKHGIGSGYLMTAGTDEAYMVQSMSLAHIGGLSLVFGMTLLSGVLQLGLSRIIRYVRWLFPPEVTGVIIVVLGFSLIPYSADLIQNSQTTEEGLIISIALTLCTLLLIVLVSRFGRKISPYALLIGIALGSLAGMCIGMINSEAIELIITLPLFAFPDFSHLSWSYNMATLIPVLIAMLATTIQTITNVTLAGKANDARWMRPDQKEIQQGITAVGITNILAGLFGCIGTNTTTSSVGISIATRMTSRRIALVTGCIMILFAFVPKISGLFMLIPQPVLGAVIMYVIVFLISNGFAVVNTRMGGEKKKLITGTSIMIGLTWFGMPDLYKNVPEFLAPLFVSPITIATTVAILLYLLFNFGSKEIRKLRIDDITDDPHTIKTFVNKTGKEWAAPRDVMARVCMALTTLYELIQEGVISTSDLTIELIFRESDIRSIITYNGELCEIPSHPPTPDELIDNDNAVFFLNAYLISRYADRFSTSCSHGMSRITLTFYQ